MRPTTHHPSRGFTLIEALVALLLASVGLLGVARLQVAVSGDGSSAAQQLEAQRLLSDKIEEIRQLNAVQLAAFASGSDQPSTASPVAYARRWNWVAGSGSNQRMLQVSVDWTDRSGQARSMKADTLVQAPEGRLVGAMTQPLGPDQTIRGPLDRYIDIPLAAELVGDGRSAFTINKPPSNVAQVTFVWDDMTGRVVERCSSAPSLAQILKGVAGCQPYNGVVLSGFVGGANQTVALNLGLLGLPLNITIPYPSNVDVSQITGEDNNGKIECEYRLSEFDPFTLLAINGSSTYRYLCVIPLADNSPGWSGYLQMAGSISVSVSLSVCRYQYPNVAGSDPNRRNVQQYRNVTQSLFNQNYRIVVGSSCGGLEGGLLVEHQRCLLLGLVCALNRT